MNENGGGFRKRYGRNGMGEGRGPLNDCSFQGGGGGRGEGATLYPKIYNTFFYDIRLLIRI